MLVRDAPGAVTLWRVLCSPTDVLVADALPCVARCVGVASLAVSASGSSTPVSASLACLAVSVSESSTSVSAVNNEFDRKSVTLKRLATLYKSSAGILKCTRIAQAIILCQY